MQNKKHDDSYYLPENLQQVNKYQNNGLCSINSVVISNDSNDDHIISNYGASALELMLPESSLMRALIRLIWGKGHFTISRHNVVL